MSQREARTRWRRNAVNPAALCDHLVNDVTWEPKAITQCVGYGEISRIVIPLKGGRGTDEIGWIKIAQAFFGRQVINLINQSHIRPIKERVRRSDIFDPFKHHKVRWPKIFQPRCSRLLASKELDN